MQIDEAKKLGPGDQVHILSNNDSFTVMLQPKIRARVYVLLPGSQRTTL